MPVMVGPEQTAGNLREYTVSELAGVLKRTVETTFERVRVRGEISGLVKAASGHLYLSLKDRSAVLDTVVWRSTARRLSVVPEDGLEVVCDGRMSTYAPRSRYQLVVDSMAVAGAGALLALLEERRRKLAAEGLFDDTRKRAIPFLPATIGIVTSPAGAAVRDILRVLADRFPRPVHVWPVRVQGEGAAEEIARAIAGFDGVDSGGAIPRPDVLIVARGGGSIEDLWAFNEEVVVRAAAACRLPLISAVGHETDTTLIDHAADWRAPTPTAAAEKAVPVRSALVLDVLDRAGRLVSGFARLVQDRRRMAAGLARGLPRPRAVLGDAEQRLDDRTAALGRAVAVYGERCQRTLADTARRLEVPTARLAAARGRQALGVGALFAAASAHTAALRRSFERWSRDRRLTAAAVRLVAERCRRLDTLASRLESVSYRSVLARGYAVVHDSTGIVRTAAAARRSGRFDIEFQDGRAAATIVGRRRERPPSAAGDRQRRLL